MSKQLRADMMLVLVTLCWGISYYLMDLALRDMGPFTLNAYRFVGAFVVAGLFSYKQIKTVNKVTMKYSIIIGTILLFVYTGATFGVKYTSLSNSGFICALSVLFTPVLAFIFLKKKQDKKTIFAVIMCLIGIMLLTLKGDFSVNMHNLKGDLFCLMCALSYAIHLLVTEHAVSHPEVNAYQLGVFQLGVNGIYMTILSFLFEVPHLPSDFSVWFAVIFLSLFCTGLAFIVQTIAQQYTTATHVGIIFTLEPVFAGIVAFFLAGEVLSTKAYIGAILMISALFITEIDFSKFIKKENS